MSRANLARLGGLAAGLGGVLSAAVIGLSIMLASGTAPFDEVAVLAISLLTFPLAVLMTLLLAIGLTGLYALLGRRSKLGIAGLILAYLSVLVSVFSVVFSFYSSYRSAVDADPGMVVQERIFAVGLTQELLLAGGILLVGMGTITVQIMRGWMGRWRLLPWVFLLTVIVALFPVLGLYFDWPLDPWKTVHRLLTILLGLLWVVLGIVLWIHASRRARFEAMTARRSTPAD